MQKFNPFLKGIQNTIQKINTVEQEIELPTYHFLNNMIQGQFVHYFSKSLCVYFEINEIAVEQKMMNSLSEVMSTELFQNYRQKITKNPELSIQLATKLLKIEEAKHFSPEKTDKAYLYLLKKYFSQNNNIQEIIDYILCHYEIKKEILIYKFSQEIDNKEVMLNFKHILEENKNHNTLTLFQRYIDKKKQRRLAEMIMSGDWMIELSFFNHNTPKE